MKSWMVRPVGFIFVLFAVEVNCTPSGGIGRQFETSAGVENTNMHRFFNHTSMILQKQHALLIHFSR